MNSRRAFIKQSVIAAAGLPFLRFSSKNSVPYADTIGLQVYTVRNQLQNDPATTLKTIKDLGYHQVELMDLEIAGEQINICRDLDLKINSSFINWNHITGGWQYIGAEAPEAGMEQLIELAAEENLEYLVFGYMRPEERGTKDQYMSHIEALNLAGEQCKAAGIQLGYHNHAFEFEPIDNEVPYEWLISELDPELVKFELDVFWADIAGWDPVALIDRLGERISLLHLKDKKNGTAVTFQEGEVRRKTFKELGNGVIDIEACMQAGKRAGVSYCFVEQDQSPNPIRSIETSVRFVQNL